ARCRVLQKDVEGGGRHDCERPPVDGTETQWRQRAGNEGEQPPHSEPGGAATPLRDTCSRRIWRLSAFSTLNRKPPILMFSSRCGMRPNWLSTRPPIVSKSSSGNSVSKNSLNSGIGV